MVATVPSGFAIKHHYTSKTYGVPDSPPCTRDSFKRAILRNTFEQAADSMDFVPDAPVSKVVVSFEGGNKGLLVNSTDLCKGKHRAIAKFTGHNGKVHNFKPVLQAKCGGKHKKGKRHHRAAG